MAEEGAGAEVCHTFVSCHNEHKNNVEKDEVEEKPKIRFTKKPKNLPLCFGIFSNFTRGLQKDLLLPAKATAQ